MVCGGGVIYLNPENPSTPECLKCIPAIHVAEFIFKFAGQAGTDDVKISYPFNPDIQNTSSLY